MSDSILSESIGDMLRKAAAGIEGDPPIFDRDLRHDIRTPCNDCPFRKSSPFHAGVARTLPTLLEAIDDGKAAHTCHKTDPRPSCDGPRPQGGTVQHCAGMTLMLIRTGDGADLQRSIIRAIDDGRLDIKTMAAIAETADDVYTVKELRSFYLREIKARFNTDPESEV